MSTQLRAGKVYLLGAGPGDIELLTLKAVRVLGAADVILIDNLVNREVLQFVRSSAEIIEVGKRGGCKSTPQNVIHDLLVFHARAGSCVVRVKGGDPLIFGRSAEEITALNAAGIETELVAGLTAGIAAAHALGVALTNRDAAHGVTFVTGHCREGVAFDWSSLANSGTTIVVYMGLKNVSHIVQSLIAAGMSPDKPAAIIESASLPEQRSLITTLGNLPVVVIAKGVQSPAIVLIGDVVSAARANQIIINANLEPVQSQRMTELLEVT